MHDEKLPGTEADQDILRRMRARDEVVPRGSGIPARSSAPANQREDLTPEEAETRAEKKAKIAQLLHRGLVNARLEVKDADPNYYYTWIREHDPDIERMHALGFEIVTKEGSESALHGTGDNRRRLGDVILMKTSRENYEIIQEVKTEKKARKSQLGKREYLRRVASSAYAAPALDPMNIGTGEK